MEKFSKLFSKKTLALILSIALIFSCVTVAFSAQAEEATYKVVIDSTGTYSSDENTLVIAVSPRSGYNYVDAHTNAMVSAINAYINKGIKNPTVYISGEFYSYNWRNMFANTNQLDSLKIVGYHDGAVDSMLLEDMEKNTTLACDLEFDNINLLVKRGDNNSASLNDDAVFSNNQVITFGENVKSDTGISIGAHPSDSQLTSGTKSNNVVINGGTYGAAFGSVGALMANAGTPADPLVYNVNYTINGGTFVGGFYSVSSGYQGGSPVINGNIVYTVNGGKFNTYNYMGASQNNNGSNIGNTIFVVNGGNFSAAPELCFCNQTAPSTVNWGNIALIVNSYDSLSNIKLYDNGTIHFAEGKKGIFILNNARADKSDIKLNNTTNGGQYNLHYIFRVFDGSAEPVFSETADASQSTLLGFKINYKDRESSDVYTPYIGETSLAQYYDEETGLYDLSAFEQTDGFSVAEAATMDITFKFSGPTKVVIDTSGTLVDGAIVDGYALKVIKPATNSQENHGAAFVNAINALINQGAKDAVIYIYTPSVPFETYTYTNFNKMAAFDSLRVEGFAGADSAVYSFVDTEQSTWVFCDMIFDNLTVTKWNNDDFINSNGYTVTIGEGVVTAASALHGGSGGIKVGVHGQSFASSNNVVINSGTVEYVGVLSSTQSYANTTYDISANYTFNGGSYSSIYSSTNSSETGVIINGDVKYTFNGGVYNKYIMLGGGSNQKILGDTIFTVNGGEFKAWDSNASKVDVRAFNIQPGSPITDNGNVVIVLNSFETDVYASVYSSNTTSYAEGKKEIVIVNNAEFGNFGFDTTLKSDYMISVTNGKANPILTRKGSDAASSTLDGFTITPDEGYEKKLVVANGVDVLTAVNGVYDLSKYEDAVLSITFVDEVEIEATEETVTGTELDAYKNGEVPAKEGYLFAGYFADGEEEAMTADELANAESVIVKFVPKAVLDVKWQIRKADNGVDLRFISTVDSLEYKEVIFKVQVEGKNTVKELSSKRVYTGISGYGDNGGVELYAPTINSAASKYFMTHVLSGVPTTAHESTFTVTACFVTKDEKVIEGETKTFKITDDKDYTAIMAGNAQ